jgi:protein gp37
MATKISYVNETWNPITGCHHVSPGCDHCYAEQMAARIVRMSPNNTKYCFVISDGKWNSTVYSKESCFDIPYKWKKPRRIFVCSMGDLFANNVPSEWIDHVMSVIADLPQHTFLVLTKRPARMLDYFSDTTLIKRWSANRKFNFEMSWPLKNLWLGVTAENQEMANFRVPLLLHTPAAKRYVSYEPALGPVDFTKLPILTGTGTIIVNSMSGFEYYTDIDTSRYDTYCKMLDWIICGAESGSQRRVMDIQWARSVKNQCESVGTPFYFKQKFIGRKKIELPILDGKIYDQIPS